MRFVDNQSGRGDRDSEFTKKQSGDRAGDEGSMNRLLFDFASPKIDRVLCADASKKDIKR